jgi:hypothetical protein
MGARLRISWVIAANSLKPRASPPARRLLCVGTCTSAPTPEEPTWRPGLGHNAPFPSRVMTEMFIAGKSGGPKIEKTLAD